jgi:hypothetical protein
MNERPIALNRKIGLLLAAVLTLGIAAITGLAYREMRQSAIDSAAKRLSDVAAQLAGLFDQSGKARLALLHRIAQQPAIVTYLQRPEAGSEAAAAAALQPVVGDSATTTELWGPDGRLLFQRGAKRVESDSALISMVLGLVTARQPEAATPFFVRADTVRYVIASRVQTGTELLGFIVQRQPVAGTASAREQFTRLIGSEAAVFIGDTSGSVWSDLTRRVNGPPIRVTGDTVLLSYERPGIGWRFAAARNVSAIPWVVLIEFPRDAVLRGRSPSCGARDCWPSSSAAWSVCSAGSRPGR